MDTESPFLAMKRAEMHVNGLLRPVDIDLLTPEEKKALASLRRLSREARLDIRDYEFSQTRKEQLEKAHEARERLTDLKVTLLAVSSMFGPADIAELDAQLERIKERVV